MPARTSICFGAYQVDRADERLYRGKKPISLPPKAFAVLGYLLDHAGQLVTKAELLDAIWPDVAVSDGVLKVSIRQLRKALGDTATAPRFIETVHRRGYRFIREVQGSRSKVQSQKSRPTPNLQPLIPSLVGRKAELAQLQEYLDRAEAGERQLVFLSGEAGIGKTTLVEAFMSEVGADGELWIGRGQCIEQYGAGEAYMPVLEALGRLCREPGGQTLIELLNQHAPTWLVQMPALLRAADLEAVQRKVMGATKERMLREIAEAMEVLTAQRPLVLTLEDLHWSDHSTLDLLSTLARRQEHARLLVLGTYRPVDVIVREHPLKGVKHELELHGQCEELPLAYLTPAAVGEYLAGQLGKSVLPAELARLIHQRTDGNPLFMINAVDYAVQQGLIVHADGGWELKEEDIQVVVPATLRQMVEQQIERLQPIERQVLEVASVAGVAFSAVAATAGMEEEVVVVEEQCEGLRRQGHFIQAEGIQEWPDGTLASYYCFVHALYQEVLYERVGAARRVQLHRLIGAREERGYGEQAGEIAAELAMHFERGRDYSRAVQYLEQAGKNAKQRSANVEAIQYLTKGIELLKILPDTPEHVQQELMLQVALGAPLIVTKSYASPEVEQVYARARELCHRVGETPQLFPVLYGLCAFYVTRADHQKGRELAEQLLRLAQNIQDSALLIMAHRALGTAFLCFGEDFVRARDHFAQALALYNPQQHGSLAFLYGIDPGVVCLGFSACTLWQLGYPDQALKSAHAALSLAQQLSHSYSLAGPLWGVAQILQFRREVQATQERAEAGIKLSTEYGLTPLLSLGQIKRGWALAQQGYGDEGITQIQQGIAQLVAIGVELNRPYYLALLAEAYEKAGKAGEGLTVLTEALDAANKTGDRFYAPELYRLKGELLLQAAPRNAGVTTYRQAQDCFQKAIEIAHTQSAKSLELRAVMSLARLWQQKREIAEARKVLVPVYEWFTEGFDTADLKDAKALLEELS